MRKEYIFLLGIFSVLAVQSASGQTVDSILVDTTDRRLEEVVVTGTSVKTILMRSPFAVQVLELKGRYGQAGDVGNLLNQATGVKLRDNGSIGSAVEINLGGLQGKAIKFFKDGIPIELFGHGFSLGTIPVNMLERVEIYNGAMPVYLAADALGGGVNLVTRQPEKDFGEVSYEMSSFGTHRATANLFFLPSDVIYGGVNASFNYSDNAFNVLAPFVDRMTGQQTYQEARRFHDATRSYYGEGYLGLRPTRWADDLRATFVWSDFYKEIQHDVEMNQVYGEAFSKEKHLGALMQYRKSFLQDRLKVHMMSAYSKYDTRFIDTATVRYDWNGQIRSNAMPPGEINGGNDQKINFDLYSVRINGSYTFWDRHTMEYSELYYRQQRKGSDPLGAVSIVEQVDVLTVPATYRKNVRALALRSLWVDQQWESIIALKHYAYRTYGFTTDNYNFAWTSEKSGNRFGFLSGIKWSNDHVLLKGSYEYATRLPDEYEVFGDARMVKENLDLEPEKSHNLNLNARYTTGDAETSFSVSTNLFYRRVKDIIFLQLDIPFNRYINYEASRIKGVEIEVNYRPIRWISGGINATYQDIRRVDIAESMFRNLEGSRVPNIPYLFGNAFVQMTHDDVLSKGDHLQLDWSTHYTHRFFLKSVPKDQEPSLFGQVKDFQTTLIIPRDGRTGQWSQDVALRYRFVRPALSLSLEGRNVGNKALFDNFNVQRPGRSWHIKLVYQFI